MIRFEVCPSCLRKIQRSSGLGRVRRILEQCPTCRHKVVDLSGARAYDRLRRERRAQVVGRLFEAITRGIRV